MSVNPIPELGPIRGLEEVRPDAARPSADAGAAFQKTLIEAVRTVDGLQKESAAAQVAYAQGADVELHDVLIKIEEADLAFRALMEIRSKLIDAYNEVMRMGSGG